LEANQRLAALGQEPVRLASETERFGLMLWKLELVRSDARLYVTIDGATLDGGIDRASLIGAG
jgi:hypothetical protein